jgi:hypothetical protein
MAMVVRILYGDKLLFSGQGNSCTQRLGRPILHETLYRSMRKSFTLGLKASSIR